MDSGNDTIGALEGATNIALPTTLLNLGGNNASTSYSGVLSGGGALTKLGTGTQTLSGLSTFSGNLTITAEPWTPIRPRPRAPRRPWAI